MQRLILLGAPGCGKGTQSSYLKETLGLTHLSTGDMLREAVAEGTAIGLKAKDIMSRGELVPDSIVLRIVKDRLSALIVSKEFKGFILDGFPRTVAQAEGLDQIIAELGLMLDAVIYFECPTKILEERICGRRIHPASGRTYHVTYRPPKRPGQDDVTGEPLIHRTDDRKDTFQTRYNLYLKTTAPLIDYYNKRQLLYTIPAGEPTDKVQQALESVMQGQSQPSCPTVCP
eukprot:Protomagalhaensia_sp_Gyna_25__566@NODE_1267_length_1996_cov_113_466530_g1009_i0_p2_GENE_NODE_1267_length_1996_cov_113_466530_g1009_i0NODE_1267_length_1996_cov_113_466530_g1009_i0_p2_ORF_typecomplete_len230_score22_29ADK/PF00406_22/6e55AAA_17/PF13207_6/4_1e24ADK_lid/PF05191_14/3_9e18AAA_18/PF13238_6/2_2e08AAA_33/PF13671_6/3_4e08Cytidylate_kin/PF02224_18/0_00068CoaE/PF01121_20/0_0044Thymidylate_kin/PF02223_17/0_18Hydin_ADK/PF17213_3/0_93Hydin_ADK/PF17213_3/1_2e02RuvB_N/PF05496_12/0_058tRNA_lig_kin